MDPESMNPDPKHFVVHSYSAELMQKYVGFTYVRIYAMTSIHADLGTYCSTVCVAHTHTAHSRAYYSIFLPCNFYVLH
jgi:hypothetical protein